jgi:hypothetical protein
MAKGKQKRAAMPRCAKPRSTSLSKTSAAARHVGLRPVVTGAADWRDKLHPTNRAWERCADVMHRVIAANVPNW